MYAVLLCRNADMSEIRIKIGRRNGIRQQFVLFGAVQQGKDECARIFARQRCKLRPAGLLKRIAVGNGQRIGILIAGEQERLAECAPQCQRKRGLWVAAQCEKTGQRFGRRLDCALFGELLRAAVRPARPRGRTERGRRMARPRG